MMDAEPGRGVGMRSLDGRFWQFAGAYATTALADGVRFAALPLLAASLTHRPLLVALVGVGESLPWLVVGLPSGVLVDRHDRKRVVQVAAVVREVVMLVLIAALLLHRDTVALLIGLAFLLGSADTFSANAQVGLVRSLVRPEQMEAANSVVGGVNAIGTSLVGPALGRLLFAAGILLPFGTDLAAVGLALLLLVPLAGDYRAVADQAKTETGAWREMREGVVWLWGHRPLRTLALLVAASNLAVAMLFSILVLFVLEVMNLSAAAYGPLLASLAVGALGGALLGGRDGGRWRTPLGLAAILLVQGLALAALAIFPIVPVAVVGFVLGGLGAGIWDVMVVSYRQRVVPDAILGRVTSGFRVIGIGATPVGALLGGVLAGDLGLRAPVLAGGAISVLAAGVAWRSLSRADLAVPGLTTVGDV